MPRDDVDNQLVTILRYLYCIEVVLIILTLMTTL